MKKIEDFINGSGINKEFFQGFEAVYKILTSQNFLYKKASETRINDVEGILSYLKSNSPVEDCGIQMGKDIVKKMREEFGLEFFFALELFFNMLKYNQIPISRGDFYIDNELKELVEFIKEEQKKTKLLNYRLPLSNVARMSKRMNHYGEEIQTFIENCVIKSYQGKQIRIDSSIEDRSSALVNYYEFKARPDIEKLEDFKTEAKCIFIKNNITHSIIWDIAQLREEFHTDIFLFYDECDKNVETGLKNIYSKGDKWNVYPFKMGKQFFIEEVFNVLALLEMPSDCIFINSADSKIRKFLGKKNDFHYTKQFIRFPLKKSLNMMARVELLKGRLESSKDKYKILSKIQEMEGNIYKATLNIEDLFRYKGIEEKLYSMCHFFKSMSNNDLCYSKELMVPKIYNFLEERYNNTHNTGFYILRQGFYKILVNLFKDKDCDLYLVLENARKENEFGYKTGNNLLNFFEGLEVVPLDYYTKSLEIVNSSMKELSRGRFIIV